MMASAPDSDHAPGAQRRAPEHESFLTYRALYWAKTAGALSLAALLGYLLIDQQPRPNGGSWYGYTLGTIGLGLIVWLAMLGIRKRRISEGRWSLKAWASAHVYLGLALVVIGTLHSGFQLGWNVHTLAWGLMLLVVLSGIYGVAVYAVLPARLSANRKQMTRAEMAEALAAIDRKLAEAAQPLGSEQAEMVRAALGQDELAAGVWARLGGRYRNCATRRALENLAGEDGAQRGDDAPLSRVRALLQKRAAQLEQIRRHIRLKALLEIWLFVHVPATIALLAALFAHVVSVFYYW